MHPSVELYPWISAGAIAWGLLDCFFGYRFFKVTVTLLGAVLGAYFGQAADVALNPGPAWAIGGLLGGALLGAGLGFLLYIVAVFVAGFGFGASLGILLLTQVNQMVALLSGCLLGIFCGFLAVKLQRPVMILATAFVGAFRAMLAATYFTAHLDWLYYFQQPQQLPALIENNSWMLPAIFALATVGTLAQFGFSEAPAKKKARSGDE